MRHYSNHLNDRTAQRKFEGFKKRISQQANIAVQLAGARQEVLQIFKFGKQLERTPYHLNRVASPVIAVVGASSAGKSSLINASYDTDILPVQAIPTTLIPVRLRPGIDQSYFIGTPDGIQSVRTAKEINRHILNRESNAKYAIIESPNFNSIPWEWLDMPGTNVEILKDTNMNIQPWDLADLCVIATPATQPLSLSDVQQVLQLSEVFPNGSLIIAITRCDQVDNHQEALVENYIKDTVNRLLPNRKLSIFRVSSRTGSGLWELISHLSEQTYELQRQRLREQLAAYRQMLKDLERVLKMRGISTIRINTIDKIHATMDRSLVQRISEIKSNLPRSAEQISQQLARSLPAQQRQLASQFKDSLTSKLQQELITLGKNMLIEARNLAEAELTDPKPLGVLTESLTSLFSLGLPIFVDKQAAVLGGAVGAMLGLLIPGAGWALAGAALATGLAGGLLGGLLGGGKTIMSIEQLRESIARPLTIELQAQLDQAVSMTRIEISHFCDLMKKVVQIFSDPQYANKDFNQWDVLLQVADSKRASLEKEFENLPVQSIT